MRKITRNSIFSIALSIPVLLLGACTSTSKNAGRDPAQVAAERAPQPYQQIWVIKASGREGTVADRNAIMNKQIDSTELRFYPQNAGRPGTPYFLAIRHCSENSREAACRQRNLGARRSGGAGYSSGRAGSFSWGGRAFSQRLPNGQVENALGLDFR